MTFCLSGGWLALSILSGELRSASEQEFGLSNAVLIEFDAEGSASSLSCADTNYIASRKLSKSRALFY